MLVEKWVSKKSSHLNSSIEKKGLRGKLGGKLFLNISDDFYFEKVSFSEFFDWTIKNNHINIIYKATHLESSNVGLMCTLYGNA